MYLTHSTLMQRAKGFWYVDAGVVLLVLIFFGCARHDSEEAAPDLLTQAKPMWEEACATYVPSTGCDSSTFAAWMSDPFCPGKHWIDDYKVAPGIYWRLPKVDCLATEQSASQCSRDTYLPKIFAAFLTGNLSEIQEIHDVGEPKQWIMCDGDESRTSIKSLAPLIHHILDGRPIIVDVGSFPIPEDWVPDEASEAITGFRAHLAASYLWFRASVLGGLTTAMTLKTLHDATPASPYLAALYHRYDAHDNDQSEVIPLMQATPHTDDTFDWGGSDYRIHLALAYQVLAGLGKDQ